MNGRIKLVLIFASLLPLWADGVSCESSPAVETAQLAKEHQLEGATFEQGLAIKEAAYRKLTQMDAGDYRPVREYLNSLRYDQPEKYKAMQEKAAAEHEDQPVAVLRQEMLLLGKDTPRAIQLLTQLAEQQPNFAPTFIQQAGLYDRAGKYVDKDKAAQAITRFYQLCPSSRDGRAMRYLKQFGTAEQKKSLAVSLRMRLAGSNDLNILGSYADVWSLEFSSIPVTEHPKERQKVADDLIRLRKLKTPATAQWLSVLKDGAKQSGASEADLQAMDERILKEFPQSEQAFSIWYDNWKEQHAEPAGEASAAEWQQYMRLAVAHYNEVPEKFPQEHGFGYFAVEYGAYLNEVSAEELARTAEAYIKDSDLYEGPAYYPRYEAATTLLRRNVQPGRALALLKEARTIHETHEKPWTELNDYAKPKDIEDAAKQLAESELDYNLVYLRACRAEYDKAAAEELKASVEAAPPTDPQLAASYWNARALLAEIEARNTDALAFYQKSLFTRQAPKPRYGKVDDFLLADAKRLWLLTNGSEEAFAVWSKPDQAAATALAEGRWEKPEKELPAFELADLHGKTWKLTSLEGKKVLINVWATWCGPCQSELPHLEKLYEETKDRSDIAILTLNFDEDQGMIEPFVKKKGFTFPVLPAYALLTNKIDVNSIPRNWLVGANGKWQWEQIGFDSGEADWGKSMLARLREMK